MIITLEQQQAVVESYAKQGKNLDQIDGFTDGMNEMFKLIQQIQQRDDERKPIQD